MKGTTAGENLCERLSVTHEECCFSLNNLISVLRAFSETLKGMFSVFISTYTGEQTFSVMK
jgi:hypothetical protein